MKFRSLRILEYSVILIPILVAVSQFFLYKNTNLTLWKGGGFGMYSDPHPAVSRHIWLTGESAGTKTYYRLLPLDERLDIRRIPSWKLRDSLYDLADHAWDMRNFPELVSRKDLSEAYACMLLAWTNAPTETAILPRASAKLILTELRITPDFKYVGLNPIYEHQLTP